MKQAEILWLKLILERKSKMEEKEMRKGFREIDDSALEAAAGGFVGKDKYDQAIYNKYGVTHDENFWTKDKYWYQGNQITQKEAEDLVAAAIKMGSTGVKQNFR